MVLISSVPIGIVDNEDIYENDSLDVGEDVIDFGWGPGGVSKAGTLQKDTNELPNGGGNTFSAGVGDFAALRNRALTVLQRPITYFRRSVRLVDAAKLQINGGPNELSETKGITFSSENMVYIWGNYNTSGVASIPTGGSTLNDGGYLGPQVPSSIVCDAVFPLSRTWYDGLSVWRPRGFLGPKKLAGNRLSKG